MFSNRKPDDPAFEPDLTGSFVATMDGETSDLLRFGSHDDLTHRLIGRKRQPDGSTRLVVLSYRGGVREVDPNEPHRVLSHADTRAFSLRAWQADQRQAARDTEQAARVNARRKAWRDHLRTSLVIHVGAAYGPADLGMAHVPVNQEGRQIASELIADGLARSLDDESIVTTQPAEVDMSRWPYTGAEGSAEFTPAAPGARILVHRTPARSGALVQTGRYLVVGAVTQGEKHWTAYLAAAVELAGPGVEGVWDEDAAVDVRAWRDDRLSEDERQARRAARETLRVTLRERLRTRYAVTPRNDVELAVCKELLSEGICYEVEGSYVLAQPV